MGILQRSESTGISDSYINERRPLKESVRMQRVTLKRMQPGAPKSLVMALEWLDRYASWSQAAR